MGYNKKRRNQLKSGKSQKFFLLTLLLMRAQTRPPLQVPQPTFPSVLSCTFRTNQSSPKANIWRVSEITRNCVCSSYHSSVGVLGSVAERAGQGRAAAFVVVSVLSVVDGAVDRDRPHGSRIPVAITIVLLSPYSEIWYSSVSYSSWISF